MVSVTEKAMIREMRHVWAEGSKPSGGFMDRWGRGCGIWLDSAFSLTLLKAKVWLEVCSMVLEELSAERITAVQIEHGWTWRWGVLAACRLLMGIQGGTWGRGSQGEQRRGWKLPLVCVCSGTPFLPGTFLTGSSCWCCRWCGRLCWLCAMRSACLHHKLASSEGHKSRNYMVWEIQPFVNGHISLQYFVLTER